MTVNPPPPPYTETDTTGPINEYGCSKLAGERLLQESGCRNSIVRIEWTYGKNGSNFVTKIIEASHKHDQLKVIDDQIGSPTATTQAAEAILSIVHKKPEGLFHFADDGFISRFELAEFIFKKLDINIELVPCKTSEYKTAAKRPLNSRFDCTKIKSLLDKPIETWQTALEKFLRKL